VHLCVMGIDFASFGCVYMDLDQNNHSRTINVKNAYLVQIRVDSRLTKIYIVVLEVNTPYLSLELSRVSGIFCFPFY
jgi:hypothetical protein